MLYRGFFALMCLGELSFPNHKDLRNYPKVKKQSSVLEYRSQTTNMVFNSLPTNPVFQRKITAQWPWPSQNIPKLPWQLWLQLSLLVSPLVDIKRRGPNKLFLHVKHKAFLRPRCWRTLDANKGSNFTGQAGSPNLPHSNDWKMVIWHISNLYMQKPCPYPSLALHWLSLILLLMVIFFLFLICNFLMLFL